jgi:hypothetical protein
MCGLSYDLLDGSFPDSVDSVSSELPGRRSPVDMACQNVQPAHGPAGYGPGRTTCPAKLDRVAEAAHEGGGTGGLGPSSGEKSSTGPNRWCLDPSSDCGGHTRLAVGGPR